MYLCLEGWILGTQLVDELAHDSEDLLVILTNDRTCINSDPTGIWDHIRFHTARNGRHVHGEIAQQGVLLVGDMGCGQGLQQLIHLYDGVYAQVRHRAVSRFAFRVQFQPEHAFFRGEHPVGRRLTNDHEPYVAELLLLHQTLRPHRIDFFPGGPGKEQITFQGDTSTAYCLHCYHHGRDTRFHIGGAKAPDLAIAHLGSEDVVLPVLACWHGVQMTAEQERRPLTNAAYATNDTRPPSFFVRYHIGKHPGAIETCSHARRHGSFIPGRIDTANTHKIARQLYQFVLVQVS